jgi:hypothetical protein
MKVAALYVDARGPYASLRGVDAWPRERDARGYAGPHPVVAHPPCGAWGGNAHLHRAGDRDLALLAIRQVQRWGGVLEHPARSALFAYLPKPGEGADRFGGYSLELDQCEWGHVARKRTWLYLVRVPPAALKAPPFFGREPTHWVSGRRRRGGSSDGALVPAGVKVCSRSQRNLTPPRFARYLVSLARAAAR